MKDSIIIPTVNLANLANNISKSPSTSNPCSPHTKILISTPYEYDGCMLCVNGTPSCLQKRRATWTLKLRVALYCLSVLHPEKKYFNLKKDIYTYVDSHWDHLSINTAKSDRWRKQVQDSLSHCRHFESGWDAMGCNGHWRLIQPLNPWSLPPDKENSIYDDEESNNSANNTNNNVVLTPEAGLSPRTTKSPREDPLYRNFPKRKSSFVQTTSSAQSSPQQSVNSSNNNIHQEDETENRKRKAHDEERFTEEELVLLKYSPMIFSDTPSPKCRTPRGNNPPSLVSAVTSSLTTSPSIVGNSPLLTASGVHFSLSNFNNNLSLNGPSVGTPPQHHNHHHQLHTSSGNITILDGGSNNNNNNNNTSLGNNSPPSSHNNSNNNNNNFSSVGSPSLLSVNNSNSNNTIGNGSSPPIPSNPFSPWKNSSTTAPIIASSSKSPSLFGNSGSDEFKLSPLPNPFHGGNNNYKVNSQTVPGFSITNNSTLKVPSELLKSSIHNSININSIHQAQQQQQQYLQQQQAQQQAQQNKTENGTETIVDNNGNPPASPNSAKLTKIQQQNLILNCTY